MSLKRDFLDYVSDCSSWATGRKLVRPRLAGPQFDRENWVDILNLGAANWPWYTAEPEPGCPVKHAIMSTLTTYWIASPLPHAPIGFGVTAESLAEALGIIRVLGYASFLPEREDQLNVQVDFRVDQIESDYVRNHMGPVAVRGMWYPFVSLGVPKWAEEQLLSCQSQSRPESN